MPRFEYPCPGCRTTSNLHAADCRFDGVRRGDIEKAYVDIVAQLSTRPVAEADLRTAVHGDWDELHAAALDRLRHERRVTVESGALRLLGAEEYREEVSEPHQEPLATIYQKGSVPGAHDNSVFALIAWYEMVGLSWEETKENVREWLEESGTWDRGGFEEATPGELVDTKRHVYEASYGWKEKAKAAKAVIDRSV